MFQFRQIESDCHLHFYIQIQRIVEEANQAFNLECTYDVPDVDAIRIGILTCGFKHKMAQLRMSIPAEIWSNGGASQYTYRSHTNIFSAPLRLAFYHAKIYTNEVGLHSTHITGADTLSSITPTTRSWYQSSERSETLIQCLQATKEYLDQFLALSPEAIAHITTPAFLHLIYAVLVLGSLATTTQSPRLDATYIRSLADFESYISALSRKSQQTIATPNIGRGTHKHMSNLHHLWQQSKPWYAQSITGNGILTHTIGSFQDLSFMDILSTIVQRCSSSPMLCDGSLVRCE